MNLIGMVLPWWVRPLAILLVGVSLYGLGRFHQAEAEERDRDERNLELWKQGDEHVQDYLRRLRELADPTVVGDRVERLCDNLVLPGPRALARAAEADAADRRAHEKEIADARTRIRQLGAELVAVQDNRYQCEALIGHVKDLQD